MGVWDFFKNLFQQKTDNSGSQRSLAMASFTSHDRWNLEIEECPVRNVALAHQLIEMREVCYEVNGCLEMILQDSFSNLEGDDQHSWRISEWMDLEKTVPIHPEVKAIADEILVRKESPDTYLIGGDKLEKALENVLIFGDCFIEMGISKIEGEYRISKLLYLPTWELFRIEDDQGFVQRFEQRKYIGQDEGAITFEVPKIIHLRHRRKTLYGRSAFKASVPYWENLKESVYNLRIAARVLAMNPNLHRYSEKMTKEQRLDYRNTIENRKKKEEILTDIYLPFGMDIAKISNINASLKPLVETALEWRSRMIIPGVPTYNFPNFPSQKARDISGEPSRRYSRMISSYRDILTKCIKQVIDTEIVLIKGYEWYKQNAQGQYRVEWNNLMFDQTSVRPDEELSGVNDRGNEGEEDN